MSGKPEDGRLYERVSRDLAARIASGEYPVGSRLPAERNLASAYSVSRPTIREAIIALEVDGFVSVRMGSGVYVVAAAPAGGVVERTDPGPFELLEARRAIEGEACALAAMRITEAQLAYLETLVEDMRAPDVLVAEEADRAFHVAIATASQNSAILSIVESLWEVRARSPHYRLLSEKAHQAGLTPRHEEHARILDALRERDPDRSRHAMRAHLSKVLESILAATEVHEMEMARARVAAQRERYVA